MREEYVDELDDTLDDVEPIVTTPPNCMNISV